jgi:hypothetical protein
MGAFDEVEVFVPFDRRWVSGFELADVETAADGATSFRLRRRSDGSVLPAALPPDRVRPANSAPLL